MPGQTIEHALGVAAHHQLLDEQAGHDGLAGAGVVGEQEVQRLAAEHLFVDRRDLMRQRHDVGGADGEQRIEEVGELDAARLADEAEERAVGGERPGLAGRLDAELDLVVAIQQLLARLARVVAKGQRERGRAVPLHGNDSHRLARDHASHARAGRQVFETSHFPPTATEANASDSSLTVGDDRCRGHRRYVSARVQSQGVNASGLTPTPHNSQRDASPPATRPPTGRNGGGDTSQLARSTSSYKSPGYSIRG